LAPFSSFLPSWHSFNVLAHIITFPDEIITATRKLFRNALKVLNHERNEKGETPIYPRLRAGPQLPRGPIKAENREKP
jgi:hypothetical protein